MIIGRRGSRLGSDVSVAQLKGDGPAPRERDHRGRQCPALRPGSRRPATASAPRTGPASARAGGGRLAGAAGWASVGRPALLCSPCQKHVTGIPGCLLRCDRLLFIVLVALSLRPRGLPMPCLLVLSVVDLTLSPGFSQGNQQMLAEGLTPTGASSVESLSGESQHPSMPKSLR